MHRCSGTRALTHGDRMPTSAANAQRIHTPTNGSGRTEATATTDVAAASSAASRPIAGAYSCSVQWPKCSNDAIAIASVRTADLGRYDTEKQKQNYYIM